MTTEAKTEVVGGEVGIAPVAGAVALRSLTMRNVLSFGESATVELSPLNVLIGPNGCGKSNLMDVVALLKSAATGYLSDEFRGGAADWPWKGGDSAQMEVNSEWGAKADYRHDMVVSVHDIGAYAIDYEKIDHDDFGGAPGVFRGEDAESRASILRMGTPLAVRLEHDSAHLRELAEDVRGKISAMAGSACVYRNRYVGRGRGPNPLRVAGRADGEKWRIPENLDDFSMVLNRVYPECGEVINEKMRELYEDARKVHFSVFDGGVQIKLEEANGRIVPAHRMSDGMLNWLFLLTVLLDPKPPALVCIDEPETGLHMDSLPALAELLRDASSRTQVIVTTHSDMLVNFFTDIPESVLVCDKADGVTQMRRLCARDLEGEEGLGDAWISGVLGGKRW